MSHGDHGTVLAPRQAALVFDPDEGWSFFMPEYGDDEEVPEELLLLGAILTRLDDREWVEEMIGAFRERSTD